MSTSTRLATIAALVFAAGCAAPVIDVARAESRRPAAAPAPNGLGRFVATVSPETYLTVEDTQTGFLVIAPNAHPVVLRSNLDSSVEFVQAEDGGDFVITLTNNTSEPQELGTVTLAGMRLGNVIEMGDFRHDSKFIEFDSQGQRFTTAGRIYPDDLYSPVGVIRNDDYTIGMSLHYPILEYEHRVRPLYYVPGGHYAATGPCWNGEFGLLGELPPGETRTYTLAFRVTSNDRHWLHTLVPYRDYFQEMYGAVRYERDPRPVFGVFAAANGSITAENPRGFDGPRRPDENGWGPWADFLRVAPQRGFHRVMVWSPTGLFRQNQQNNYPFLFMSGMDQYPMLRDTASLIRQRVADNGIQVGFWWGRSSQVMRSWDTADWEPLDPDNPEHVQRGMRELDLAVARGATLIGLDAFVYAEPWDAYRWLEMMRERHPEVKFVIEPSGPDFQHILAATFTEGLHHIETPPLLQDFLIPGHEMWANTRFDLWRQFRGVAPTDEIKNAYWRELAEMGYVPLSYEQNTRMVGNWSAAEGWLVNIPEDLRSDPRTWTSPGSGGLGVLPGPDPEPEPDPEPDPQPGAGGGGSPNPAPEPDPQPQGGGGGGAASTGGPPEPPPSPEPPDGPEPPATSQPPENQPPVSPIVRLSINPISPALAQQALARATRGSSSRSSAQSSSSSRLTRSATLAERREARRQARLSSPRYQRWLERRGRLIARLGLQDATYRERRTALQAYRAERRAARAAAIAVHPDE
ncbi:MAG: hypothetical protein H6809_06440 [Phycisphaeraceae bacterium]|nr:hypothetical protein [Phycisphaeraceae bacterium]